MMTSYVAVSMFEILSAIVAITVFIWALWNRQLRSSEEAKYAVLAADESEEDFSTRSQPGSPRRARALIAAIIVIFAFIAWSLVLTIQAAVHTPANQKKITGGMTL